MAGTLRHRRGSSATRLAVTLTDGEFWVDTDVRRVFAGDNVTPGGYLIEGHRRNLQTGTTYNVLASDMGDLVTLDNGATVTVNLAAPGSSGGAYFPAETYVYFLNLGVGIANITPSGATINGLASIPLARYQGALVVSDGSGYFAVIGVPGNLALSLLTDVNIASPQANDTLMYDAGTSKWVNRRRPYIIGSSSSDTALLTASQSLLYHSVTIDITIPANFANYLGHRTWGRCVVAPTASAAFDVSLAPVGTPTTYASIGTITIAAGNVIAGTLVTAGGLAIDADQGDSIRIQGPASPDSTLMGFFSSIVAFER